MEEGTVSSIAAELIAWLDRNHQGGPADLCYEELLAQLGALLWAAYDQDSRSAGASPSLNRILALLGLTPEAYREKYSLGREASTNGCGYWPPLPWSLLKDRNKLNILKEALQSLHSEPPFKKHKAKRASI